MEAQQKQVVMTMAARQQLRKEMRLLNDALAANIKAGTPEVQWKAALQKMKKEMAKLFVKHGGQVMRWMWVDDVAGDLDTSSGSMPTSAIDIMEGIIDEILLLKSKPEFFDHKEMQQAVGRMQRRSWRLGQPDEEAVMGDDVEKRILDLLVKKAEIANAIASSGDAPASSSFGLSSFNDAPPPPRPDGLSSDTSA